MEKKKKSMQPKIKDGEIGDIAKNNKTWPFLKKYSDVF